MIALLDPFSGISGDMTLGALLAVGLDPEWLMALPGRLKLDGVTVRIADVSRAGIACKKVDFDIPPQPHGRHLRHIREMLAATDIPAEVKAKADQAFTAITEVEAEMHGTTVERVHLHEVGAVDAILDVVGSIWGFQLLGVNEVYCGRISLGDGTVEAAHGIIPVPAPATLKLLVGIPVRPGPEDSGELVTPTGAALVRVLSRGPWPAEYVPVRAGYGAGTKNFSNRPNALRIILAEAVSTATSGGRGDREELAVLTADIDDMPGEYVASAAEALRGAGARDVVITPILMKKGRPGARLEVLASAQDVDRLEEILLAETTTIGVRRGAISRRALPREMAAVRVLGHDVRVKVTRLPAGGVRAKPEHDDVVQVARATGRPTAEVAALAEEAYAGRNASGE